MDRIQIRDLLISAGGREFQVDRYLKAIKVLENVPDYSGKFENHHILPKSMFPEYSSLNHNPWNSVKLSLRSHFIIHYILMKCGYRNMVHAFHIMANTRKNSSKSSRLYSIARISFSKLTKGLNRTEETKKRLSLSKMGKNNPNYGLFGINNKRFGKLHREESKRLMSIGMIGRKGPVYSEERKIFYSEKFKGDKNPMFGKRGQECSAFGLRVWEKTGFKNFEECKWVWFRADEFYEVWKKLHEIGNYKKAIMIKMSKDNSSIRTILRHFKKGWIPLQDKSWLKFKKDLKNEKQKI